MRSVRIGQDLFHRIGASARARYPDETCGFLFSDAGAADSRVRSVTGLEEAPNEFDGERHRRFVISPDGLRAAEARAAGRGEVVSGFYHSHPDHPAVPSAFDTEHAWPWYTYVVVAVTTTGAGAVGAFELEGAGARFVPCELTVVSPPSRAHAEAPAERRSG